MPRVSNVDNVAPDDVIQTTPTPPPTSDPITPKAKESSKKSKAKAKNSPPPKSNGKDRAYDILGHTKTALSSLLVNPDFFNFTERDDDEEILVVARQHWITNVPWILMSAIMVLVPSLLQFVPLTTAFPANYVFIIIVFWYLITFAYAFEKFLHWYFNVYIITSERVVDIDFNNLLSKRYSEAQIEVVQDVTSAVIGAIPTVFNYGNVLIQTAAEIPELRFERVPNPEKIIRILQELREKEENVG